MTASPSVLTTPRPAPQIPRSRTPVGVPRALRARALPWLVVAAGLVAAQLWTGTPVLDLLRYAAYWAFALLLPGTLVFRAVRGSRGNLPEDLAFGAVTGLVLELPAWALAVGTGSAGLLRWWPVPVVALFLAVPALRRHWRVAADRREAAARPLPLAWSWAMAGVLVLMTFAVTEMFWGLNPLPPATHSLYGDQYYHWANAAELARTITPQSPQFAGVPLHYHWISDAHRAAAHLITGVPLGTVMLRLWNAPFVVLSGLIIAALGRQVARVWWSGPLAALIAGALPVIVFWPRFTSYPIPVIAWHSPTLTYSIPILVATTSLVVELARGVRLGRSWLLLGALLIVAAGSKPSSVPILCCGLGLASLCAWSVTRRFPTGLGVATAAAVGSILVTAPTTSGGLPGSGLQLGGQFTFFAEYLKVVGKPVPAGTGGLIPPSLSMVDGKTRLFLPVYIGAWILSQGARLMGLALLGRRGARRDPAAWLLAGMATSGLLVSLTLNHVAGGEGYFWYSAVPVASALSAWLVAAVAPPGRRTRLVLGGGALLGAVTAGVLIYAGPGRSGSWSESWAGLLGKPVLALLLVGALLCLVWRVARRRRPGLVGAGAGLVVAVVVGLGFVQVARNAYAGLTWVEAGTFPSPGRTGTFWVTAAEMRAAEWIAAHAGPDDVVATNVHCEDIVFRPFCSTRSFWVSAVTERRVVIEGWAYQEPSLAGHGRYGFPYFRQLTPDQERLDVNDRVFVSPSPAAVADLRDRYGARWLFADRRAGIVSTALADIARARYTDGPVTVFELA